MVECAVCLQEFSCKLEPRRPVVLPCGHTTCYGCFQKIKACPVCKMVNIASFKNPHGLQGSFNYIVECDRKDVDRLAQEKKDRDQLKEVHYCLQCQKHFKKTEVSFLQDEHASHESVFLGDKDLDQVRDFIWIIQNPRVGLQGSSMLESFFRMWIMVLRIMITALKISKNEPAVMSREQQAIFRKDCRILLDEGIQSTRFSVNSKVQTLVHLKMIQASIHKRLTVAASQNPTTNFNNMVSQNYIENISAENLIRSKPELANLGLQIPILSKNHITELTTDLLELVDSSSPLLLQQVAPQPQIQSGRIKSSKKAETKTADSSAISLGKRSLMKGPPLDELDSPKYFLNKVEET